MAYKDFTQMEVWQRAFKVALFVYKVTKKFPIEEKYGITSDMRRAANSVTNNIAEGFGRYEKRDKTRFYKISRGSSYEVINQALTSEALHYICKQELEFIFTENKIVIDSLDSLIKTLETSKRK